MTAITSDLYFTNIRILPTAANATVCRSWYANVIGILQKQKQTFYELQIYNLIVNKYSNYPPRTYNIRRRLDFAKEHGGRSARSDNIFENNILNIAYDNMIKNIFEYLKTDKVVFLNIKESLLEYYNRYMSIHKKCCRMEILDMLDNDYIDEDIANEYKGMLLKYYNLIVV
jgi:hypothetical protein